MAVFIKRKKFLALEQNRSELHYLHDSLSQELIRINSELRNIEYRINFFGVTDKLLEEKKEILIFANWLKQEIDETFQTLHKNN
ncbi:hypothetical protein DSAG12_01069 [Promethearchaeum syntrophicum]|uniref:Uncharacterized protein n=1 Tax=Promethearchaeum syntrophicum TaxID=2594042 RepID=A0A5B9D7Z1_9ARCH|nr:hypothetical protein [Candidatus Prometheoarchaeum syntrophicum]QEE15244.1 hypothetical protein DSAG12_01069 [Candidatus Prometheoarchaeum syntrophicum]